MNTKQLFLAISMMAVANIAIAESNKKRTAAETKEIQKTFAYFFGVNQYHPFESCSENASLDCDLIIEHFKKAMQHNKNRSEILNLEDQMDRLSTEQLQRPVQKRLTEAKQKHPHGKKSYWSALPSESEQNDLIEAAAKIAEESNYTMHYAINTLKKELDK